MTISPSDFAATFRATMIPRLRRMIEARGLFVALCLEDFTSARTAVIKEAIRLGAGHMATDHLNALTEWVDTSLLAAIDAKDQPRDDKVWRNVLTWDAAVLAHFEGAHVG